MRAARLNARRFALLAGLALGVLALHAWLLSGEGVRGRHRAAADAPVARGLDHSAVVAIRLPQRALQAEEPAAATVTPPPVVSSRAPAPRMAVAASRASPSATRARDDAAPSRRDDAPSAVTVERAATLESDAATLPPLVVARRQPEPDAAGDATADPPVYPTRPPPPFAWRYAMQRGGAAAGEVEWRWQQAADGSYAASLEGRDASGARRLAWRSVGGFDAAGLAPLRYTDRRPGRSELAANFDRDAGTITFSGPRLAHRLAPGAQDGLSWLLQLAAIAAADPSRVEPGGAGLTMRVVGVRGEADDWRFEPLGRERIELVGEATPTLLVQRLPQRAYDVRAQVWLDPARDYLPVRVRLAGGGSAMQLEWLGAASAR